MVELIPNEFFGIILYSGVGSTQNKTEMIRSVIHTLETNELNNVVKHSKSIQEVLYSIGLSSACGSQHTKMKERLQKDRISTDHFYATPQCISSSITFEEYIKLPGLKRQMQLRVRILREKLLAYECKLCTLSPTWNGERLTLQLDHIDGQQFIESTIFVS